MLNKIKHWAFIAFLIAIPVAAGVRDTHLHQFPPQDMGFRTEVLTFETYTNTSGGHVKLAQWSVLYDQVLVAVKATVRNMTGTITTAAIALYNNDLLLPQRNLATAVDLYGTGLASAGTVYDVTFIDQYRPLMLKSGDRMRVDLNLAGSSAVATPTLKDITLELVYRTPVGQEN